jgi:hypothetical protein
MGWTVLIGGVEHGTVKSIDENLNDHEEAILTLPNDSTYRAMVKTDQTVAIQWDGNEIFTGTLRGAQWGKQLEPKIYNSVYSNLKKLVDTPDVTYTTVSDAMDAVCVACGVTKGLCPTKTINVKFVKAKGRQIIKWLAQICGMDYWTSSPNTINIGTRGSSFGALDIYDIGDRGTDRELQYNHVWVKGTDDNGNTIWGEAKAVGWSPANDNPLVKKDMTAHDLDTLNSIAENFLATEGKESTGAEVYFRMDQAYNLKPGDLVTLNRADLDLVGTYKVYQTHKAGGLIKAQIDRESSTLADNVLSLEELEDMGIYLLDSVVEQPVETSSQNLAAHYRLNEGYGDVANDSTPARRHGGIYGGTWVDAPVGKMLQLTVGDYIETENTLTFAGTNKLSIATYVKVTAAAVDANYLVYKGNQFFLQHYGTSNQIRFGVFIGGAWRTVVTDVDSAPLGIFKHIVAVYDGAKLKVYIDGALAKEADQTGNMDASSSTMYLGANGAGTGCLVGTIYDTMIFGRAVEAAEAKDLYMYPLRAIAVPESLEDVRIYGLEKGVSYICRPIAGVYECISATTGKLVYGGFTNEGGITGTDPMAVLNAASQNLIPADRSHLAWIIVTGSWPMYKYGANDYCWKITQLTGLDLRSAVFWLQDNQNCDMLRIESAGAPQFHCWVMGGIFEGNKANQTVNVGDCIKVWNGSHCVLQSITVRNAKMYGIRLTGDASAWAGLHRVLDCRAYYNGHTGFVTNNQSDNTFINCIAECNTNYGFWLIYPQQLYRCHAIGLPTVQQLTGFYIQSHCHMIECYADTSHRHGFFVQEIQTDPGPPPVYDPIYQLWFNNCYAYRGGQSAWNTYDGFHVEAVEGVQFVNCRSKPKMSSPTDVNYHRHGFYINGCHNSVFSNCVAERNNTDGFFVEACTGVCITGCKGQSNERHGIRIETSTHTSVTGCSGIANVQNGCSIYDADYTTVVGGTYCHNDTNLTASYHGVSINTSIGCIIAGVIAVGNDGYGIYIAGLSTGNIVMLNSVSGVTGVGAIGDATPGQDTIIKFNAGFKTEANGTAVIGAAATSVVVYHGLARTPKSGSIQVSVRDWPTADIGFLAVDSVTATTFRITCRTAPGGTGMTVGWSIA